MKDAKERLIEIRDFIRQCREEGEEDLRPILHFVDVQIEELEEEGG